jgi:hypothetical protein
MTIESGLLWLTEFINMYYGRRPDAALVAWYRVLWAVHEEPL